MSEMMKALSQVPSQALSAGRARCEGRPAAPSADLRTDLRLHPSLRDAFAAFGTGGHAPPPPLDHGAGPAVSTSPQ
jgi:hypothetical protein